jgi:hypothetical protein
MSGLDCFGLGAAMGHRALVLLEEQLDGHVCETRCTSSSNNSISISSYCSFSSNNISYRRRTVAAYRFE